MTCTRQPRSCNRFTSCEPGNSFSYRSKASGCVMCAREYAGSDQLQKVSGAASFPGMSDAIARYEKMVEQFPQNELGRFSLGKALFDAGQFARAKEHLEVALAKKPDW